MTLTARRYSGKDRDARPLNVMRAFSAAQLKDKFEKMDRIWLAFKGTLKSLFALSINRGMPEPMVALLAAPSRLVVVHPVASLFVHVRPVNPLIHTQLQLLSEFKIATPPFWQVMTPSHWSVPGLAVGAGSEGTLVLVGLVVPWVS